MTTTLAEQVTRGDAMHTHVAVRETIHGYQYSVATSPAFAEPRAAGGICTVETCGCGAQRRTNSNGRWIEQGAWVPTLESEIYWASRGGRPELIARAKSKGLACVGVDRHGAALVDRHGKVTEVPWGELRAAARQDDPALAAIYASALADAERERPLGCHW